MYKIYQRIVHDRVILSKQHNVSTWSCNSLSNIQEYSTLYCNLAWIHWSILHYTEILSEDIRVYYTILQFCFNFAILTSSKYIGVQYTISQFISHQHISGYYNIVQSLIRLYSLITPKALHTQAYVCVMCVCWPMCKGGGLIADTHRCEQGEKKRKRCSLTGHASAMLNTNIPQTATFSNYWTYRPLLTHMLKVITETRTVQP